MASSGFDVEKAPLERRALGYRWEDDAWRIEPTLGPGVFGAMGGLQTSANDYAKWVAYLLSAWPARDGVDTGPVRRCDRARTRARLELPRCAIACRTGTPGLPPADRVWHGHERRHRLRPGVDASHSGGYPGYGSHVLLLPDRGIGIFAFANRTYAGPSAPVWDAAVALDEAGLLGKEREIPVSADLANAYRALGAMYAAGSVAGCRTSWE